VSSLISRSRVPRAEWDGLVEACAGGWVWHTSDWIDYLVASGREDRSVARVSDTGHVTGINVWCGPVPADDPLPAPLMMEPWLPGPYRSEPSRYAPVGSGFWTRVLDLARPPADLWREMRRSYHALIHRAEGRYACAWGDVDDLRVLYDAQPELPTLTPGQWRCVERVHAANRLAVLVARDAVGQVAGAIGIYVWRGRSYYGHGRSRDKNVNHLLQWRAIQSLPLRGVRWYEIGWEARPEDDEKARAIAYHKKGFAGERWWITVTD